MKYLYKHGNKFWYQRSVPLKLVALVGIKNIKVPLNTNKVQTAITRSKLQAIEHKKMFNEFSGKSKNSFLEIIKNKKIKLKDYEINFLDDYEDFVSDLIFSKESFSKIKISSIKKYFLGLYKTIPNLSVFFNDIFIKEFEFKPNQFLLFKKTLKFFISNCGDRPINSYSSIDIKQIQNISNVNKNFRIQYLKQIFSMAFKKFELKKKIFPIDRSNLFKKKIDEVSINLNDCKKLEYICKNISSLENSLLSIMLYTGCNLYELMGLEINDIYLDNFQPFIIIRSNSIRPIKSVYKKRTIPLVGISRVGVNYILNKLKEGEVFFDKKKISQIENLIKKILIENFDITTLNSIKLSLVSRLIKVECPEEVILEIIGRSKRNNIYNREISLDVKRSWLEQLEYYKDNID